MFEVGQGCCKTRAFVHCCLLDNLSNTTATVYKSLTHSTLIPPPPPPLIICVFHSSGCWFIADKRTSLTRHWLHKYHSNVSGAIRVLR